MLFSCYTRWIWILRPALQFAPICTISADCTWSCSFLTGQAPSTPAPLPPNKSTHAASLSQGLGMARRDWPGYTKPAGCGRSEREGRMDWGRVTWCAFRGVATVRPATTSVNGKSAKRSEASMIAWSMQPAHGPRAVVVSCPPSGGRARTDREGIRGGHLCRFPHSWNWDLFFTYDSNKWLRKKKDK